MATFQREPLVGGDFTIWGEKELEQNRLSIGNFHTKLYDDSGILKIAAGRFGIYTGSTYGTVIISSSETINITSINNSNWGLILATAGGSTITFSASNITGATNPNVIPIEFTGAYNNSRSGYYSGAARIIGAIWKTSGGALGAIVNVNNGIEGYTGKTGNSQPILNIKSINYSIPVGIILPWHKNLTGVPNLPDGWVECDGSVVSDPDSPLNGQTLPNLNGDGRFLRGSSISGTFENDQYQDHAHELYLRNNFSASGTGRSAGNAGADANVLMTTNDYVRDSIENNGNGTPRVGSETRPINMSVVFIIKIK